jgi:hypothetical protein
MTWFKALTGIEERSADQVRSQLSVDGDRILCPNGKRIAFGQFETPTLGELRERVQGVDLTSGSLQLSEVRGDVRQLHADSLHADAMFQVASQFNLLEMTSPMVIPEEGVGIYEYDPTQGPACAIACGAGTIYRNYFVNLGDQVGQSKNNQLDCASDLGRVLGNEDQRLWQMENGYLLPTDSGLKQITRLLHDANEVERDQYRASLRIGLQWNTQVTLEGAEHCVSQAYCSALPVAYGRQPVDEWAPFAKLILEAAYEATFCAAILNAANGGSNKLFLTMLGGGVFGNRDQWIIDAIHRAVEKYRHYELDVAIVSYRASNRSVQSLVHLYRSTSG